MLGISTYIVHNKAHKNAYEGGPRTKFTAIKKYMRTTLCIFLMLSVHCMFIPTDNPTNDPISMGAIPNLKLLLLDDSKEIKSGQLKDASTREFSR